MSSLKDLSTILKAKEEGRDLIEDPSVIGGMIVDDETLTMVADLETVAAIGFNGDMKAAIATLLQVILKAPQLQEPEDPYDAGRDWLDGWLDLDQAEIA